jgi:hypothetical protein
VLKYFELVIGKEKEEETESRKGSNLEGTKHRRKCQI